ncbi:MAG: hypothetical protein M1819_001254 [Sarea resinae]|nr:MAG: hypothetical protein M1819_001254 [Sarea resinae]
MSSPIHSDAISIHGHRAFPSSPKVVIYKRCRQRYLLSPLPKSHLSTFLTTNSKTSSLKGFMNDFPPSGNTRSLTRLRANQHFPFQRLPPELRTQIYSYLFSAPFRDVGIECDRYGARHGTNILTGARSSLHPNILRTSKAIHAEASAYLYRSHTFRFMVACYASPTIVTKLLTNLTPTNRSHIKRLALCVGLKSLDSEAWPELCALMAHNMALEELDIELDFSAHCSGGLCRAGNCTCFRSALRLDAAWVQSLVKVQNLHRFSIHTVTCDVGSLCGFHPNGGPFKEKLLWDRRLLAGMLDEQAFWAFHNVSSMAQPRTEREANELFGDIGIRLFWRHKFHVAECLPRDFVEGIRKEMGLHPAAAVAIGEPAKCRKQLWAMREAAARFPTQDKTPVWLVLN